LDLKFKEIAAAIDISKDKFDICIRNHREVTAESSHTNNITGCEECYKLLANNKCNDVCMESTGPYWYGVYDYLTSKGMRVIVVNPSKARTNLKNKSDRIDSRALATLHLLNMLEPSFVPDPDVRKLRRLTRLRMKMVKMKTQIKNIANGSASAYSSDITRVFGDMFGKSGRKILDILGMDEDEIMKELNAMKISDEKKQEIIHAINKAYAPSLDSWMIQFASSIISQIEAWVKVLDNTMAGIIDANERIKEYVNRLITIPGVGLETAQVMAAEIADMQRFRSARALVRYSGLNPTILQSGSVRKHGALEKAGPPILRAALFQAAYVMAFRGPDNFKEHYNAVSSRYGKRGHGVAVVSTARKLLHLVYSMLTNKTDYVSSPMKLTERKRRIMRKRVKMYDDSDEKPSMINLLLNMDSLNDEVKQLLVGL
jgi:transposase